MNNFDSVDSGHGLDIEEAWAREIERRVAELDSGTAKTVSWEEVRTELLRRIQESATD